MMSEHPLDDSLPVFDQVSDDAYDAVAGGQPVLLVRNGRPAAVMLDYESWQEVEALASEPIPYQWSGG
jgi:PHD/YefM family antitoxin component YafN of YafNO toxin-antitoxin module